MAAPLTARHDFAGAVTIVEIMQSRFDNRYGDSHKEEWLTPPYITFNLGPFDLDPCSPIMRPWETASSYYTENDNGLILPWAGRVWMNPPYGDQTALWIERLAEHGNGIALVFNRTDTDYWENWIWPYASGLLFISGRLTFYHVDGTPGQGNAGCGSVLIAYGKENAERLRDCQIKGAFIESDGRQYKRIQRGLFD